MAAPAILQHKSFGTGTGGEVSSLSWTLDSPVPSGATIVVLAGFGNGWADGSAGVPATLSGLGATWTRIATVPIVLSDGVKYRILAAYVGRKATGGSGPITGSMSNTRYAARVFVLSEGAVGGTAIIDQPTATATPTISLKAPPGSLLLSALLAYDDVITVTNQNSGDAPAPFTPYSDLVWSGGGNTDGSLNMASYKPAVYGPATRGITLSQASAYRGLMLSVREEPLVSWWSGADTPSARFLGRWDGAAIVEADVAGWWDGTGFQPVRGTLLLLPVTSSAALGGTEGALKLVDGSSSSKWYASSSNVWIALDTEAGLTKAVSYEIVSGNDTPARDPKDWTLSGSSDGGLTWTVLDAVAGQPQWSSRGLAVRFSIDAPRYYQRYKWEVTAVSSGSAFQAAELRLLDAGGATIPFHL